MPKSAISIEVKPKYMESRSMPERNHFVFNYEVKLRSFSEQSVRLISRCWKITDANGFVEEIESRGLPEDECLLLPHSRIEYKESLTLKTPVGALQGQFTFRHDNGQEFVVDVAAHRLAKPDMVH